MKFTEVLKLLIDKNDVTMAELSKGTGIAKSTIHNLINGTEPTLSKLQALASYFGVSIDYLTTGREVGLDPLEKIITATVHKGIYEVTIKKLLDKEE